MHAIELDAIAHDGKITVTLPEAYREPWNEKAVRVFVLPIDEKSGKLAAAAEDFNPLVRILVQDSHPFRPKPATRSYLKTATGYYCPVGGKLVICVLLQF